MNHRLSTILRSYVDGTNDNPTARLFRALALSASIPYALVVRTRNFLYDAGFLSQIHVDCATFAIGNLTMGGVGKTPFVGWLTRRCMELNRKPGVISRGYKAKEQKDLYENAAASLTNVDGVNLSNGPLNDEAREQAIRFPNTPHFLGSKRVEVANELLTAWPTIDVLLLDDAFQHRQIARDLNILIIDALNPFGGSKVAPAGFLREPLSGMKRADAVVLNRADLISQSARRNIQTVVKRYAPHATWAEIAQRPNEIYQYSARENNTRDDLKVASLQRFDYLKWRESVKDKRFVAFCGLGAPAGFQKTLEQSALDIASFIAFPDHCIYDDADYRQLQQTISQTQADAFITTTKDFVKLERFSQSTLKPIYALGIGVEFITGQDDFERLLLQKLQRFPNKLH